MNETIFKYGIKKTGYQEVDLPEGSIILDIQLQNGIAVMWVQFDMNAHRIETRKIHCLGTGSTFSLNLKYLKTIQDGSLVLHFYEEIAQQEAEET